MSAAKFLLQGDPLRGRGSAVLSSWQSASNFTYIIRTFLIPDFVAFALPSALPAPSLLHIRPGLSQPARDSIDALLHIV